MSKGGGVIKGCQPPDITAQTAWEGCDIRYGTTTFSNLQQKYSKENLLVAIVGDLVVNSYPDTSPPSPIRNHVSAPDIPVSQESETLHHRDDALLYIAYVMLIWDAPIPADRWHCSMWP